MALNHDNNYTYHRPPAEIVPVFQAIREKAKELALLIDASCPDTRERSIAHTHIETAVMWANAAIARQYPAE
jgi:hypothetical protein